MPSHSPPRPPKWMEKRCQNSIFLYRTEINFSVKMALLLNAVPSRKEDSTVTMFAPAVNDFHPASITSPRLFPSNLHPPTLSPHSSSLFFPAQQTSSSVPSRFPNIAVSQGTVIDTELFRIDEVGGHHPSVATRSMRQCKP